MTNKHLLNQPTEAQTNENLIDDTAIAPEKQRLLQELKMQTGSIGSHQSTDTQSHGWHWEMHLTKRGRSRTMVGMKAAAA